MNPRTFIWLTAPLLAIAFSVQAATAPGDALWDFRFGRPGLSGAVTAAWYQGRLYVGGVFDAAGHFKAENITGWDGHEWRPVGEGLHTGGAFTNLAGIPRCSIARWNGTNWSALGSGLAMQAGRARVYSFLARDDGLWVGGLFSTSGNKAASGLAHWVESPAVWLSAPEPLRPSGSRIRVNGALGLLFTVETSPDLQDWTPATDVQGSADTFEFIDPAISAAQFYRAVLTP